MIYVEYQERLRSLKKTVCSLAVVALFGMIGFTIGAILGSYYLAPTIKPRIVNGVAQPVCGQPILMAIMGGACLGMIPGTVVGGYVARRLWWPAASWKFMFWFVAAVLILFCLFIP
jgi:hypothetical protein